MSEKHCSSICCRASHGPQDTQHVSPLYGYQVISFILAKGQSGLADSDHFKRLWPAIWNYYACEPWLYWWSPLTDVIPTPLSSVHVFQGKLHLPLEVLPRFLPHVERLRDPRGHRWNLLSLPQSVCLVHVLQLVQQAPVILKEVIRGRLNKIPAYIAMKVSPFPKTFTLRQACRFVVFRDLVPVWDVPASWPASLCGEPSPTAPVSSSSPPPAVPPASSPQVPLPLEQ